MTLKIEEGKFYRTRDGSKAGPMCPSDGDKKYPFYAYIGGRRYDYTEQGKFWADSHLTVALDLISEWVDEEQPADSVSHPPSIQEAILRKAEEIVNGSRRGLYGEPEDNFERIARFWQAYFENTGRPEAKITAKDVSPLMRFVKEARLCERPEHFDSHVDLVGYALTGARVNGVSE